MSRVCELSGVGVQSGHKVSHSERKTKRKFLPNLQKVTLVSDSLNANFRFRVIPRVLGSIEIKGGFDNYLLNAPDHLLSKDALTVKKKVKAAVKNSQ